MLLTLLMNGQFNSFYDCEFIAFRALLLRALLLYNSKESLHNNEAWKAYLNAFNTLIFVF